ncbi:MAG: methyltransferase [Anaerolineae bacterium]|nr:methyltransferase [Anaerolineae bacterium]
MMEINGFQKLRKHFPDLQSRAKSFWLSLLPVGVFTATTIFFINVNRVLPIWGPDGQVIVLGLGFYLMWKFFSINELYTSRYGELAYRNAFVRFALPGMAIIIATIAYTGYIPGPWIQILWWDRFANTIGWFFMVTGGVLWIRSIYILGIDNITHLYVYFHEEGHYEDSSIYEVLRHPIYAGLMRLGFGLAILNGNIFSIIFGVIVLPFGFIAWVILVEEKDLLKHLGNDYAKYRKQTPAFLPRFRDLGKYYSFLLKG